MMNLIILYCTYILYCADDKIEKNETGGARSAYGVGERILVGKPEGKRPDVGVDGRIILRRFFSKWDVGVLTGLSWLRLERVGRHL
jgi:hypothetical protein